MAQMMFFDANKGSCAAAVAPNVLDYTALHTVGEGSAPVVAGTVASGDPALQGGTFANRSCRDVQLTITYLDGGDCSACSIPSELTTVDVVITVPSNSQKELPPGYWTNAQYVLLDSAGAPADLEAGEDDARVYLYVACNVDCPECVVAAP